MQLPDLRSYYNPKRRQPPLLWRQVYIRYAHSLLCKTHACIYVCILDEYVLVAIIIHTYIHTCIHTYMQRMHTQIHTYIHIMSHTYPYYLYRYTGPLIQVFLTFVRYVCMYAYTYTHIYYLYRYTGPLIQAFRTSVRASHPRLLVSAVMIYIHTVSKAWGRAPSVNARLIGSMHLYVCVCICMYVYIHIYVYVYTCTHTLLRLFVLQSWYTYIYIHICIYTYIYIYINTHIYTHAHAHAHALTAGTCLHVQKRPVRAGWYAGRLQ